MDDPKKLLITKLSEAKNVLVTVSRNPSVDQLAALMGLTLAIDKSKKHAAAIFSGKVPSTLEFLQPEDTIQTTTDSLRDFIISLDRSKASKLRYTAEEDLVKVYITPYRSPISPQDLSFDVGEFNVDLVIALGVKQQHDIDQAIMSHGSILHDATVATINLSNDGGLGNINWNDENASSLCELVTELIQAFDESLIDGQIATSLLTGIVAETARFSNDKTSSQTMSASAALMTAGANQQLIATQLEQGAAAAEAQADSEDVGDQVTTDGTLEIDHTIDEETEAQEATEDKTEQKPSAATPQTPEPPQVPEGNSNPFADPNLIPGTNAASEPKLAAGPPVTEENPPMNSQSQALSSTAAISSPSNLNDKILTHGPAAGSEQSSKTLVDIEKDVNSPHVQNANKTLNDIEKEVNSPHLYQTSGPNNQDISAMNSAVVGGVSSPPMNMPDNGQTYNTPSSENQSFNANAAPPVPPPLPFNSNPPESQQ